MTVPFSITDEQKEAFGREGYWVVRNVLNDGELTRLDRAVLRAVKAAKSPDDPEAYPARGVQHTILGQNTCDPDLLFIAEHPGVVEGAELLLGSPVYLSAFVSFLKTPGAQGTIGDHKAKEGQASGSGAHCDYKTYHQAGSSLNWLFAIMPLVDLDRETGCLLVSPGSHKLTRVVEDEIFNPVRRVERANASAVGQFIDPRLRRGDLLFLHMFTWHQGLSNRSNHDRYGIYNKYRACHAPPACGPTLFSEDARNTFSQEGKRLLPHFSRGRMCQARLLLEREGEVLFINAGDRWELPGGSIETDPESSNPDCVIEQLELVIHRQLGLHVPWMTYIDDYADAGQICRVYACPLSESRSLAPKPDLNWSWFNLDRIRGELLSKGEIFPYTAQAVDRWHDPSILRGIGESMSRGKAKSH